MKGIWEQPWFFLPVMFFFGIGVVMASRVPYGHEILFMNDWRQEPFITLFRFLSWCGETWMWVVTGLAALFWRYRFALLIATTGLIMPFVFILKDQMGVDRPITYFQKQGMAESVVTIPEVRLNMGQTSFPSGHTMSAFGLCSLLALLAGPQRRWTLVLALLAIAIGVSRIFLVQHFLVDVLGGALLGMLVSGLVWRWNQTPYMQQQTRLDGRLRWNKSAGISA
jgi:membrane-associated phospholipid phosphatase